MREYESIFTGSNSDSLVSEDKLRKSRVLGVAEWEASKDRHCEYVLAYDVARSEGAENALSALVVIKITKRSDGTYIKELVNIFSAEGQHDTWQAKFLKQKVKEFNARILIVDANGIGSGVVDQLVLDLDDGNPAYKVVNDEKGLWRRYESPDSIPIVFALKAQNKETKNSDMINNLMKVFNKVDLCLLKSPHEGLKDLEKKYKKKFKDEESEMIVSLSEPYVYTDLLCEEIMNLKYKQKGNSTEIERVSNRIPKDKFSALLYGLYWIYLEEKKNKVVANNTRDFSNAPHCVSTVNF